ncbi:MAG: phosphorylase [Leptolyngbyaceae bacterium]|nr:phosphorylase [Leptolyngbyaceae bacterium]
MTSSTKNTDSEVGDFSSEDLWDKVQSQTAHAIACGALQSIPTHCEYIEQNGVSFLVRSLDTLARKEQAKKRQQKATQSGKPFNPFLPYEEDLFVNNLSETHLCLLNKYNVVNHHLLIVTRAFEEQETWLNQNDFSALWQCLSEIDGLGFYNGGKLAGASQSHKHLQLIPQFQASGNSTIPLETVLTDVLAQFQGVADAPDSPDFHDADDGLAQSSDCLPFHHAIAPLLIAPCTSVVQAGEQLVNVYQHLLTRFVQEVDLKGDRQTLNYNLLVTQRWMMVIPRTQESYASISVNSLGFAGSLFVRDENQLQILRQTGPMTLLENVAQPKSPQ